MDLSRQKGINVKNKINEKCLIISCDTIIYMNGKKYEKPKTKIEAKNNIKEMIGNTTYAYTGVTIIDTIDNVNGIFLYFSFLTYDETHIAISTPIST